MAHEIKPLHRFRHTDYMNRSSCGQNANEGSAGVGAVWIPGTPTTVTGSYNSWMMACTNNNPAFSSSDGTALNYVLIQRIWLKSLSHQEGIFISV